MNSALFFKSLENHFQLAKPFVAFRKPHETRVNGLLQNNSKLYEVHDFLESGFVFAPFNNCEATVIIPQKESRFIKLDEAAFNLDEQKKKEASSFLKSQKTPTDKEQHIQLVEKGIKTINNSELKKIVLSRKETIPLHATEPIAIFKRLIASYTAAFVYCWYHPKAGLWMGATPETLLTLENQTLKTMSLAGTQTFRENHPVIWEQKEREEQQIVTDFIVTNLEPFVSSLKISDVETIKAGTLLHLKTEISAKLNVLNSNFKSVIESLHPTPAVCGMPRDKAREFILDNEHYNRSFYTGYLGELNFKTSISRNLNKRNIENNAYSVIKKTSNLFVNLRCMQLENKQAHVFVGGGITGSSNAKLEWEETQAKSETMKKVLL